MFSRDGGDRLCPGGRVGLHVIIAGSQMLAAIPLIDTVIGHEQVVDTGYECVRTVGKPDLFYRDVPRQDTRMVGRCKAVGRGVRKIGEPDLGNLVFDALETEASSVSAPEASRSSRFHLPSSPQRNPIEPFGTTIFPDFSSSATVFQSGLLLSPSAPSKSAARRSCWARSHLPAAQAARAAANLYTADIVPEVRHLPVAVIFRQDNMAKRHAERRISPCLAASQRSENFDASE
jgi:hypothetical protein